MWPPHALDVNTFLYYATPHIFAADTHTPKKEVTTVTVYTSVLH